MYMVNQNVLGQRIQIGLRNEPVQENWDSQALLVLSHVNSNSELLNLFVDSVVLTKTHILSRKFNVSPWSCTKEHYGSTKRTCFSGIL